MNDEAQPVEIDITVLAEQAFERHQSKDTYIEYDTENCTERVHPYFYWDAAADVVKDILQETGMDPIDLFKLLKNQGGYEDQVSQFSMVASGAVEDAGTFTEIFIGFSNNALSLKMFEMNPSVEDFDEQKIKIAAKFNPAYLE